MIDLTPLDVRTKRGDFKRILRGYDPQEVDVFLEIVAERLEEIVRENIGLKERAGTLEQQVTSQTGREQAVHEALVTAQELRADIHGQAQRESEHLIHEAETEARRRVAEAEAEVRMMLRDAERKLELGQEALEDMERRRTRFLKAFRQLLEREMDVVEVEEERPPLEDRPIDLDLGSGKFGREEDVVDGPAEVVPEDEANRDSESSVEGGGDLAVGGVAASVAAPLAEEVLPDVAAVLESDFAETAEDFEPFTTPDHQNDPSGHFDDDSGAEATPMSESQVVPTEKREASFFDESPTAPEVPTLDEVLSESESTDDTLAFPFDSEESDDDRWG